MHDSDSVTTVTRDSSHAPAGPAVRRASDSRPSGPSDSRPGLAQGGWVVTAATAVTEHAGRRRRARARGDCDSLPSAAAARARAAAAALGAGWQRPNPTAPRLSAGPGLRPGPGGHRDRRRRAWLHGQARAD